MRPAGYQEAIINAIVLQGQGKNLQTLFGTRFFHLATKKKG